LQALLYGLQGDDIRKIVVLGKDETTHGALGER